MNKFRSFSLLCFRGVKQFGFSSFVASLTIAMAGGLFLGNLENKGRHTESILSFFLWI
jgi:hypothetical protein